MALTASGAGGNEGVAVGGVLLRVDHAAAEAPFRQLRTQITDAINSGELSPGTRLPTIRALAKQVGVAARTAAKVYRELETAGVLETRGRSGTFVAEQDLRAAALLRAAEEFVEHTAGAGFSVDEAVKAVRTIYARGT